MNGTRDEDAARMLIELREEMGVVPTEMPFLMRKAGIPRERIPSPRSIYRAEQGVRPQLRHRAGLAQFFGVPMRNIWDVREPVIA